ncbi:hypothetical protein FS782_13700 [Agrobacterium vitis]|uniref:hypothetical protein n=1 Tax=Agrobacterium vitis TaxID=373 RepID=UPI001F174BBE|nr:hypothetical protein [Agrobacterium vitis]MCF1478125.1 hypothetical protein [Agrobacterium vitis]
MPKRFTGDDEWDTGIEAKTPAGYVAVSYSGTLGGGTLRCYCEIDGVKVPVANSKLSAAKTDTNGDVIQMMTITAAGKLYVVLVGSTTPDVTVAVR